MNDNPTAKLLLIETSGRVGRIGVAQGPTLLAEHVLDESRRHARDLAPAVADLLRQHGWQARDLAAVIASLGPGSYTGLRVGIMSAKALAYATGCAVGGVPTFHVLARQAESADGLTIEVVGDAQQEKLYVQRFRRGTTTEPFAPDTDLEVVAGPDWAKTRPPSDLLIGPGVLKALRWLAVPATAVEPTVAALLAVGWERFVHGDPANVMAVEPLYLRRSSAEEQWDRRAGR